MDETSDEVDSILDALDEERLRQEERLERRARRIGLIPYLEEERQVIWGVTCPTPQSTIDLQRRATKESLGYSDNPTIHYLGDLEH